MQHESGLFYHSPDAPIFWGRGNGWVAAAMIEVLRSLPADHPLRATILARFEHMMRTLLRYQSDNGMWRQVVDYPYSWAESSATAMFAYAMAAGINEGLLEAGEFMRPVDDAWAALKAHVDRDANLREVCVGTGKENDLEYYLKRPRVDGDLHGQAPLLWLAVEMRGLEPRNP
jgi:rhamnogalacturonyl hydrolase YesR